ncbi:HEAT repeat domain-containing protein [Limisalsivibrio acetivorans]|uniref:HEAT repeat domain-containing protein n=1 Tax=Limisalsivibrio acetivorans TaxID=1304888 RepID=UPI0003B6CC1B|nr:HEAT repeat domain-containing protein [Limisalsivibrio acetivorans]
MDIESIRKSLYHEDETERLYAVEDVISFKAEQLVPDIIDMNLREDSRMVRELIVEGLKLMDISDHYAKVAEYFESSDAFIRNCAIEIFGSKGESAVPFLTSIMDHSDKEVRKLILDCLVATSSKYSIPALRAALNDKAPNVQITAVEYLGKIEDKESLRDIVELFASTNEPMLRISCIETFVFLGGAETVDRVIDILGGRSVDGFYKPSVFRLVAEKGAEKHLDFLLSFLNNKNTLFFTEIANSILKIISRENVSELPEESVSFIIESARNQNLSTDERITFMRIISVLGADGKEKILEELAYEDDMNLMLSSLDELSGSNLEKALKIIDRRLKVAEGDLKDELINLKEYLAE